MLKNRTLLGLICVIFAIILIFCVAPLFNRAFEGKTKVLLLKHPVMEGRLITAEMLTVVEMGQYNLPTKLITDPANIVDKYAKTDLYAGSFIFPEMLSDDNNDSNTILRSLKENETAMSVTIKSLANGVSGKLMSGDIIKIVSVDDDDKATVYDELQYIEVLATTTESGSDHTAEITADDAERDLPVTITVILRDDLQALRLAECENTGLHAIFVSRTEKEKYLKTQNEILEEIKTSNSDGIFPQNQNDWGAYND